MAVEWAVQRCLAKPHVVNSVTTYTTDAPAFTVTVAKFLKIEVE